MQMLLDSERAHQPRAGRRLEYFTLAWNLGEASVAIGAGLFSGSIALIGFGADSLIESLSGGILLWRLQSRTDQAVNTARENWLGSASWRGPASFSSLVQRWTFLPHNYSTEKERTG
jgi:hypothetical protein